ncbi:MAG: aminoglycoside 6'-N-acetyltransferase [Pyrinomonadaceae bacterium]
MTEPRISVRPLEEDDLGEWFRLRKLLWDELPEDEHKAEMLDIVDHIETQHVLVADTGNGRLVGFLEVSIRPFVEDCQTDHVGYLEGWFVDGEYRGRGVGRGLVTAAENWAKQKNCTEMASDAEFGNQTSLKAHMRLGYEETSRLIHLRKEI